MILKRKVVNFLILLLGFLVGVSMVLFIWNTILRTQLNKKPIPIIIEQACPIEYDYLGEFEVTYYTATGNRTSTGVYPKSDRTVATDPRVIPYGTILYINGKAYISEDCGGDIKNNRIDIYVDSHKEAIQRGRHKAKVYKIGQN